MQIQLREEWLNAHAFDTILVNSFFSRESLLRAYGLDSKVCYLGIDKNLFQPQGVKRENFVLGLGSIQPIKGIDRAISALSTIPQNQRPALLWIGNLYGKAYQQEMEALAMSLGVNLQVKVRVTDEELVDYLNRATAMIYTSRLEPFGFAPLEANACGTPVVAIAEGGVRETITESNGFLINDNNPVELGQAILKLIDNSDLAEKISKQAREDVLNNWSWDKAIDRLEQYLKIAKNEKNHQSKNIPNFT